MSGVRGLKDSGGLAQTPVVWGLRSPVVVTVVHHSKRTTLSFQVIIVSMSGLHPSHTSAT